MPAGTLRECAWSKLLAQLDISHPLPFQVY
jgi:hypothetical protein